MAPYKNGNWRLAFAFVAVVLGFIVLKSFFSSLFFNRPDRLNFVFYDSRPVFYSLGLDNNINYLMPLYSDLKVQVPGGYGYYRLGALGKLISLEKDPEIIKRSFSALSSTFVKYYFYPAKKDVYYGHEKPSLILPSFYKVFLYHSDAGFFDKLYIFLKLLGKSKNNFNVIDDYAVNKSRGEEIFDSKDFLKKYQGFLYQKSYRKDSSTVQIIYTKSYETAVTVGNVIEGNGIRVVDLSQKNSEDEKKDCLVIQEGEFNNSAKEIARFFRCDMKKARTGGYDIIVEMINREKEWEINQ